MIIKNGFTSLSQPSSHFYLPWFYVSCMMRACTLVCFCGTVWWKEDIAKKNIATLPACLGYALRPLQLFNTRTHCLKKTIKIRYFFAYLFSHTCENIFRCTEKEIQGCRSTDFPLTVAFLTHNIYWVRDANDEQVRWYKKNKTRERTVKGYCKNTLYFFVLCPILVRG